MLHRNIDANVKKIFYADSKSINCVRNKMLC